MHISTDTVPVGQKAEFWIDLVCAHLVEVDCASVVDTAQISRLVFVRHFFVRSVDCWLSLE